jgi:hypothetical protein
MDELYKISTIERILYNVYYINAKLYKVSLL